MSSLRRKNAQEDRRPVRGPRHADACRLRLQRPATAGRRREGRLGRGVEPVPAPCGPRAQPRQHGQGLCRPGADGADRGDERPRQCRRDQGDPGIDQRSGGLPEIHRRAGSVDRRAVAASRRDGKLSAAEVRRAVPRPAVAARRHGEPDHGRAQAVHRQRAAVQLHGALVPDQPDRHDLQDGREAQLHRRERSRDQRAAQGRFRQGPGRTRFTCRARRAGACGAGEDGALPPWSRAAPGPRVSVPAVAPMCVPRAMPR
jgi:hypothetical protein